jgi:hypothetical protein
VSARTGLCTHPLSYQRYHAGFSNLGYLYCDRDDTVLTWGAYNLPRPTIPLDTRLGR